MSKFKTAAYFTFFTPDWLSIDVVIHEDPQPNGKVMCYVEGTDRFKSVAAAYAAGADPETREAALESIRREVFRQLADRCHSLEWREGYLRLAAGEPIIPAPTPVQLSFDFAGNPAGLTK